MLRLIRLLIVFAFSLQTVVPAVSAMDRGIDVSRFVCVTSGGEQSEMAERLAERFSALERNKPKHSDTDSSHCTFCLVAGIADFPQFVFADLKVFGDAVTQRAQTYTLLVSARCGPPLGATGPPISI